MIRLRSNTVARASLGAVIAAAVAAAAPAPAAAQTNIDGGGATLPSLLLRNLFDCYAVPPGGTAASPLPAKCTSRVTGAFSFRYDSVGSGAGQRGFVSQNPRLFTSTSTLADVNFGFSDAALTATNVGIYANGGRYSSTGPTDIADASDNCAAPATGNGADVAPAGGCYDNPRVENGPLVQLPFAGTSVTVAYDPVYKSARLANGTFVTYSYNNATPRADGSGGIRLTRDAMCRIFAGQITTWDDPILTAANGGTPLWPNPSDPDAATPGYSDGRAITVVHRDDDSGTTAIFTRALRAQCAQFGAAALPAGFSQRFPGSPAATLPSGSTTCLSVTNSLFDNPNGAAQYIAARGNEGVSGCIDVKRPTVRGTANVGGRIGYASPDFVLPAVTVQPYRSFGLATFDLANRAGNFIAPTPTSTALGLTSQAVPAATAIARGNPLAWVADASGADPNANRIADPRAANAYPIVGTTNILLYSCYDTQGKVDSLARVAAAGVAPGLLNWVYANGADVSRIFKGQGFSALPTAMRSAIVDTFANPSDPLGLNLYLRATPSGLCTTGS